MTPAARIAAAIELLEPAESGDRPADSLARAYFRSRRYIGSKDRRAISTLFYGVLRSLERLDWWIERAAAAPSGARSRVLAYLALVDGQAAESLTSQFDGSQYHPAPLSPAESRLLEGLAGRCLASDEQPAWVRSEMPAWLWPQFEAQFGPGCASELAALGVEAPLDLRVNTLKGGRDSAAAALAAEDIVAEPTPLSPLGLRIQGRHTLPQLRAFRDGLVEVQDEAAQVAALLCDARPGGRVADFCAGAGGKTLALAAAMADRGRLVALDIDPVRLARAAPRLARAGVTQAESRGLVSLEDPWLGDRAGSFDRVLVDAPCSGSGAWRRHPAARWRLTAAKLASFVQHQQEILQAAAALVAPAGRLIYATCSLLPAENDGQVRAFLDQQAGFRLLPIPHVWTETLGSRCPLADDCLMLTPAQHGTDGFFVAILERARPQ